MSLNRFSKAERTGKWYCTWQCKDEIMLGYSDVLTTFVVAHRAGLNEWPQNYPKVGAGTPDLQPKIFYAGQSKSDAGFGLAPVSPVQPEDVQVLKETTTCFSNRTSEAPPKSQLVTTDNVASLPQDHCASQPCCLVLGGEQ